MIKKKKKLNMFKVKCSILIVILLVFITIFCFNLTRKNKEKELTILLNNEFLETINKVIIDDQKNILMKLKKNLLQLTIHMLHY